MVASIHLSRCTIEELVLEARAGNQAAFSELVQRHIVGIRYAAVRVLGNNADAEDVTQNAFVIALKRLGELKVPAAFSGWLHQIAHRTALNKHRSRKGDVHIDPAAFCDRHSLEPIDELMIAETRGNVRAGMNRLCEMDRTALRLYYFEGRSIEQMSDVLHAPQGTVKRRLHVARNRLGKQLAHLYG